MSPVFSQPLAPLKTHSHRSQVYWTLTTSKATSLGDSKWAIHRRPERTPQISTELRHLEVHDQEARQARLLATRNYVRQGALHGDCLYLGLCEPYAAYMPSIDTEPWVSLPGRVEVAGVWDAKY